MRDNEINKVLVVILTGCCGDCNNSTCSVKPLPTISMWLFSRVCTDCTAEKTTVLHIQDYRCVVANE